MAGHHEHRDVRRFIVLQKAAADFVAIEIGQAVIEKNQVRIYPRNFPQTFAPALGSGDLQIWPGCRQNIFHENQQHLGVVDDNDFFPALGFAASVCRCGVSAISGWPSRSISTMIAGQPAAPIVRGCDP